MFRSKQRLIVTFTKSQKQSSSKKQLTDKENKYFKRQHYISKRFFYRKSKLGLSIAYTALLRFNRM